MEQKYALVFTLLFISTGIGVVLYLNQTPLQVRERDYIYVGSYLFYAICIGLGVISLFVWLRQYFVKHALYISIAIAVVCPSLLFAYNYNDHNRRNVDIAYQYSKNVLATCKPNAICLPLPIMIYILMVFTNGRTKTNRCACCKYSPIIKRMVYSGIANALFYIVSNFIWVTNTKI
jgi:hypothetical protein